MCFWSDVVPSLDSWLCTGTGACEFLLLHTSPLRHSGSGAPYLTVSHLSCNICRLLSLHKSSKYFFLLSIFFLSWSPNSINSSTSSVPLKGSYPVDLPESWCLQARDTPSENASAFPRHGTRLAHWVVTTTPPWNLWRQFNLMVLVLHLNRVTEPPSLSINLLFSSLPYISPGFLFHLLQFSIFSLPTHLRWD